MVLRSEARKLSSLRSTWLGLAVILLIGGGAGAFITAVGDAEALATARGDNDYAVIFYSSGLTTWAFVYLAASFVATEFRGMGAATFVATPRRGRVLAAKLVLIAAAGLVVGALTSVVTVAATQAVLTARGLPGLDLTDPGLIRAVGLLVAASMAVQGLIAACLAVLVRSAIAAAALTGLLSLGPVSLAPFFGDWYAATFPRWVPGAAVESLAGVAAPGSYGYLALPLAIACVAAWLAVTGVLAAARLPRMDIRG